MNKEETNRLWKSIEGIHVKIDKVQEKVSEIEKNTGIMAQRQTTVETTLNTHVGPYHIELEKNIKKNNEQLIFYGALATAIVGLISTLVALKNLGIIQ